MRSSGRVKIGPHRTVIYALTIERGYDSGIEISRLVAFREDNTIRESGKDMLLILHQANPSFAQKVL